MRLIDADALECISYTGIPEGYDNTFDSGVLWMLDKADEIPNAADVVPVRRGEWVLIDDDGFQDGERYWKCSLCGCGSDSYDTVYHTPYCPNCGAKME